MIQAIRLKGNPCVVGLDPRIDDMPLFVRSIAFPGTGSDPDGIRRCIVEYHRRILDTVADLVPAVKPQSAFYEQYGLPGMTAFAETVSMAKERGLLVIADAKRNDISSTAQAYANAFLGATPVLGEQRPIYDVDCITVSPYLGRDSIQPFVETCRRFGKGIFVLVKTSNPSSKDLQDVEISGDRTVLYRKVAQIVAQYAETSRGESGYSSIGAVVGATFPHEADSLREIMPHSVFLVPGYGAQGGTADDAAHCFNFDGLGAVVNASRSITYGFESPDISERDFCEEVRYRTSQMIADVNVAVASKTRRV